MAESKEKRREEDKREDRRKDGEFESKSEHRDERREERHEEPRKRRDYDRSEDHSEDAERRRRYGVGFAAESFYDEAEPYEGTPESVARKGRDEMTGDKATGEDEGFDRELEERVSRGAGDEREADASKSVKDEGTSSAEINAELSCDKLAGEDKGKD